LMRDPQARGLLTQGIVGVVDQLAGISKAASPTKNALSFMRRLAG
jgi:hypothetical protein